MIRIRCIESVRYYFTKNYIYEAEWTTEVYMDKLALIATDNRGLPHIVAEYSVHDKWFKEHFEIVK